MILYSGYPTLVEPSGIEQSSLGLDIFQICNTYLIHCDIRVAGEPRYDRACDPKLIIIEHSP